MGTAGIQSFAQEAVNAKVDRRTLGRARTSVAEDVLQSNLAALDDFIERTLNLVRSGRERVSHLVEFHEWDETPQSCVLEGATPGTNIAHLLQAHFGLTVAVITNSDDPAHIELDFPLPMQAIAGTTGEIIWAGLDRLRGKLQAKIDRFIALLTELQDGQAPKHVALDQADSAGANDRTAARESYLRPTCHRMRIRCDAHQLHKTLRRSSSSSTS